MSSDPIRGKTIRFRFDDGPMANKAFDHSFSPDGNVTFKLAGANEKPSSDTAAAPAIPYEVAKIRDDVYAIAYLSKGYTLTTILDFKTQKLAAFSSNEKMVSSQHGTFESQSLESSAGKEATRPESRAH